MPKRLTPTDIALWHKVLATLKPLHMLPKEQSKASKPLPRDKPLLTPAPKKPILFKREEKGHISFGKLPKNQREEPKIDPHIKKKLSRRQIAPECTLDLHGCAEEEAHRRLFAFLTNAQHQHIRLVLVITGKGRGGNGEGLLRKRLTQWLHTPPFRPLVISFEHALPFHGGEGAFYVHIRRQERQSSRPFR